MLPQKDGTYFAIARRWRPQQFDQVIGQEHITRTLKNAVSSGRIHHALLFIGSRGVGKTTTARILAKALNCLTYDKPTPTPCDECANCKSISEGNNLDVQEIDGASNNSVDNVREIREAVRLAPANARYKVYIIDEVHQLSSSAFNALLKTLEEPPSHAVFILATTEAHKIPATIISRCQRFDFRRVSVPDIVKLLERIVAEEKRNATKEALYAIARVADGAVRDAESILDQLMTYCEGEITYKDVQDVLGLIEADKISKFVEAVRDRKLVDILKIIDDLTVSGKDLYLFIDEVISFFRNMLVLKATHNPDVLCLPKEDIDRLKSLSEGFTTVQLIRLVEQLAGISQSFTSQISHRTVLEAFFVKYCKVGAEISIENLLEKLISLEEYLKGGTFSDSSKREIDQTVKKNDRLGDVNGGVAYISSNVGCTSEQYDTPSSLSREVREEISTPKIISEHYGKPLWSVIFNLLCNQNVVFASRFSKVKSATYDEREKTLILYVPGGSKELAELLKNGESLEVFKRVCNKLRYEVEQVKLKERDKEGKTQKVSKKEQKNPSSEEKVTAEVSSHLAEVLNLVHGNIVGVINKQEDIEMGFDEFEGEESEDSNESE